MTLLKKILFILWAIFTIGICCFCLARYGASLTNKLAFYPQWELTKDSLEKHVSLAYAFKHKRTALSHNQLNLGAWNGYNEIVYKDPLDAAEVSFRVYLPQESYLVFIFNKSQEDFEGIRFSSYYLFKNIYFKADKNGVFIEKKILSPFQVEPNRWWHIRIVPQQGRLNVYLNDKLTFVIDSDFYKKLKIGFRGGQHDVLIDDISIKTRQTPRIIKEEFGNKKFFVLVFGVSFIIFCAAFFIVLRIWGVNRKIVFHVLYIGFLSMFILIALNIFDYFYSTRYPKFEGKLKEKEESWVSDEEIRIKNQVKAFYAAEPANNVYRILFLGSSQTWGSGATKAEDVFVPQVEKMLNLRSDKTIYHCINGAISGTNAQRLLTLYKNDFVNVRPQMVVINLSNNDNQYNEQEFVKYLKEFVEYNIENDIKTVFILEPNSIEHRYTLPLHEPMRNLAREYGTPVIDLSDYLRLNYDTGFLWWDSVHMSSYGHALSAEFITSKIREML